MQPSTIIAQMEEYVQGFRAQIEKRDEASLSVLVANMKLFFEELEGQLPANMASFSQGVQSFKECAERFGKACEMNNMAEATEQLSAMEAALESLKELCEH